MAILTMILRCMLSYIPHIENILGTDSSYISVIRQDNIGGEYITEEHVDTPSNMCSS